MNTVYILLAVTYAMLIVAYIIIKKQKIYMPYRGIVKMSMSSLFVLTGLYACFLANWQWQAIVLTIALVFAAIGDYFLLFMKNSRNQFHIGVVAFGISNAVIIVYGILTYGWVWWSLPLWAAFNILHIIMQKLKVFEYGKSVVFLNCYVPFVSMTGCLGFTYIVTMCNVTAALVFGIGSLLFFVSDIFLGIYEFKLHKWYVDACNSVTYFGGLLIIAVSLVLAFV